MVDSKDYASSVDAAILLRALNFREKKLPKSFCAVELSILRYVGCKKESSRLLKGCQRVN